MEICLLVNSAAHEFANAEGVKGYSDRARSGQDVKINSLRVSLG